MSVICVDISDESNLRCHLSHFPIDIRQEGEDLYDFFGEALVLPKVRVKCWAAMWWPLHLITVLALLRAKVAQTVQRMIDYEESCDERMM